MTAIVLWRYAGHAFDLTGWGVVVLFLTAALFERQVKR